MAKTQSNGSKTYKSKTRISPLDVSNLDDKFDYSFRRKVDIEQGGGEDMHGFRPVNESNNSGEVSGGPLAKFQKSKGGKQITHLDVILCRRPKEIAEYFQNEENEKYNANLRFVKSVGRNSRDKYRGTEIEENFEIKDESKFSGSAMQQRKGTTAEKLEGETNG